jgi:hypothetical protein
VVEAGIEVVCSIGRVHDWLRSLKKLSCVRSLPRENDSHPQSRVGSLQALKSDTWWFDICVVDLFPNTLSFRVVTTLDVDSESQIPAMFTGRVRKSANGVLEYVAWFNKGVMENPAPRTPAFIRYRATGLPKQECHYRLGKLHDPEPGQPAVRGYFADGTPRYVEHFRYGRRHDARESPAILRRRLDGTVRSVVHYHDGERV